MTKQYDNRRCGAVLPLIALMLPILIVLSGFAINVAYIQLTATELQISTDIAAKASGRTYAVERDHKKALKAANEAGRLNQVANEDLVFRNEDLVVGNSVVNVTNERYDFTPANNDDDDDDDDAKPFYNAIEIVGSRVDGTSNDSVPTIFPSIMGVSSFPLTTRSISTQVEVDLALVLDRSGSMAYADDEVAAYPPMPKDAPDDWEFGDPAPDKSRWRDVVKAVDLFLNDLESSPLDEQVALVTYASTGRIDVGLTSSYAAIRTGMNQYTQSLDSGGTNIAAGLQYGEAELASTFARIFSAKVVILLTDGKRTTGDNPESWATSLADDGIMVIVVTFSDEADQVKMAKVAEKGNGFHVHADRREDLWKAFEKISRRLPTLLTK